MRNSRKKAFYRTERLWSTDLDISCQVQEAMMFEEVLPITYKRKLQLRSLYAVEVPANICSEALKIVCADKWLRRHLPHLKRVGRNEQDSSDKDSLLLLLGNVSVRFGGIDVTSSENVYRIHLPLHRKFQESSVFC